MLTPDKVLDNYYLDTRCMLIEIAATWIDTIVPSTSTGEQRPRMTGWTRSTRR